MAPYSKKEVLLQVEDVRLSYDRACILRDIRFSIRDVVRPGLQQGQVVSLVGRSGIGKTQLFRLLSGLQSPDTGSIRIRERMPVEKGDGSIEVYRERIRAARRYGGHLPELLSVRLADGPAVDAAGGAAEQGFGGEGGGCDPAIYAAVRYRGCAAAVIPRSCRAGSNSG